ELLSRWQHLGPDLGIGLGVASGYVTVGALGGDERLEYVAVGPAVNLASRLCDRADPGEILVDQRTAGFAGNSAEFQFQQLESADLKGFSHPVKIFKLAGSD